MKNLAGQFFAKCILLILSPVYLMMGAPIVAIFDQDKVWDYFDLIF